MFTDRFIEVTCVVYNPDEADLLGKKGSECELIEVTRKINEVQIESYAEAIPAHDFREDNKIWTNVNMKSSDSFIVNIPFKEFEKLLNKKNE
jgi:hypothetical protein